MPENAIICTLTYVGLDGMIMPFYDLRCPQCDKEYNISASMAEKTEKRIPCPDCGSLDLETVYNSAPGILIGSTKMPECPKSSVCTGCPRGNF